VPCFGVKGAGERDVNLKAGMRRNDLTNVDNQRKGERLKRQKKVPKSPEGRHGGNKKTETGEKGVPVGGSHCCIKDQNVDKNC